MNWLRAIGNHFLNWLEAYLWIPLSLLAIIGAEWVYYLGTGRNTVDDPWLWIVGLAPKVAEIVLVILFTSVCRESTGIWLNKAEQIANPKLAIHQGWQKCVIFAVLSYLVLH